MRTLPRWIPFNFSACLPLSVLKVMSVRNLNKLLNLSDETFSDLAPFAATGVIHRQGDYAEVQPLPLAMRLANMWLETRQSNTLEALFRSLSEDMKLRMAGRLRWVSWSEKVKKFAQTLISEALPDPASLNTEFGSKLLDRFVHLAPDETMDHLHRLLCDRTIDDLKTFENGRRHVVWALDKLVFRHQTFVPAARLLLRLGAPHPFSSSYIQFRACSEGPLCGLQLQHRDSVVNGRYGPFVSRDLC